MSFSPVCFFVIHPFPFFMLSLVSLVSSFSARRLLDVQCHPLSPVYAPAFPISGSLVSCLLLSSSPPCSAAEHLCHPLPFLLSQDSPGCLSHLPFILPHRFSFICFPSPVPPFPFPALSSWHVSPFHLSLFLSVSYLLLPHFTN